MVSTLARTSGGNYTCSALRTFDAWGNIRMGAATGDPKGRYCANLGHKQDDESGLTYMRARYYEPTSGRFTSEDPSRHGENWTSYCENDPVNMADNSGKDPEVDGELLLGNVLIVVGFFMLNTGTSLSNIDAEWLVNKIFDKAGTAAFAAHTGVDKNYVKLAVKMARLLQTVETSTGSALTTRLGIQIAGYLTVIYGQELLTDAEFSGGGEWWGYDAITNPLMP